MPRTPYITFSGGMNDKDDSTILNPSEFTSLFNCHPVSGGWLTPREGIYRYCQVSSGTAWTHPVTNITPILFNNMTSAIAIHSYNTFRTYDGRTVTNRSGTALTTGDATKVWSSAVCSGVYFFDDGANELLYWSVSNSNCTKISAASGYEGISSSGVTVVPMARFVCSFNNSLILGYLKEGSTELPHRIRCSEPSTALSDSWMKFDDTQAQGAAFYDLLDSPGFITGLSTLGDSLVVFKYDQIYFGRATGNDEDPLDVYPVLDCGCMSGRSFQKIDPNTGIFLGKDNIYIISGSATKPIGDKIKDSIFDYIDYDRIDEITSVIRRNRGYYYLWFPIVGQESITNCVVYDYINDKWWEEGYDSGVYSAASSDVKTTVTIDSVTATINSITATIDSFEVGANESITLVGTQGQYVSPSLGHCIHYFCNGVYRDQAYLGTTAIESGYLVRVSMKDFRFNDSGYSVLENVHLHCYSETTGNKVTLTISNSRDYSLPTVAYLPVTMPTSLSHVTIFPRNFSVFHRPTFTINPTKGSFQIHGVELEWINRGPIR